MKRQEKGYAKEARGDDEVSAEVQDARPHINSHMEQELRAIICADPRSGMKEQELELVAWTAADPSVIEGVGTDMYSHFEDFALLVCCLPCMIVVLALAPCICVEYFKESAFRRQLLRQASSYMYVIASCKGRRAYITVDLEARSVVWLHTSQEGQRPPCLRKVAGSTWLRDKVEESMQAFYILKPGDKNFKKTDRWACCTSESRDAFNTNRILQVWFICEDSTSPLDTFMKELARDLHTNSSAARTPGVTSMPSDSGIPTATTVVEPGVRLRVCLEGGKVYMFIVDTNNFDGFMEQIVAHLGLPLGTHIHAFVDVQGDRVELEPSGLCTLERDEMVVVVLRI